MQKNFTFLVVFFHLFSRLLFSSAESDFSLANDVMGQSACIPESFRIFLLRFIPEVMPTTQLGLIIISALITFRKI